MNCITLMREERDLQIAEAAKKFTELGNPTRLSIFRLLVKAADTGLSVGEIQKELDVPGSTLSHHIQRLVNVGLVAQRRDSRTLYCEPQIMVIQELVTFLLAECCTRQTQIDPVQPD